MACPDPQAVGDQLLHPGRRRRGGRPDHLGRHADRHGRLGLQQPVQDPQDPEGDPQQLPSRRLPADHVAVTGVRGVGGPLPDTECRGDQDGHDHEEHQQPLEPQRGAERSDDHRVGREQSLTHPGHIAASSDRPTALSLDDRGRTRASDGRRSLHNPPVRRTVHADPAASFVGCGVRRNRGVPGPRGIPVALAPLRIEGRRPQPVSTGCGRKFERRLGAGQGHADGRRAGGAPDQEDAVCSVGYSAEPVVTLSLAAGRLARCYRLPPSRRSARGCRS